MMGFEDSIRRAKEVDITADVTIVESTTHIYVGVSGTLIVDLVGGGTVTMVALAAGIWHPIRATKIYSTSAAQNVVVAY